MSCAHKILSSHLVLLPHDVDELHDFDEVPAAKGVVDGVSGQSSVLPVPPLGEGQLPGKKSRVPGTALHLGTAVTSLGAIPDTSREVTRLLAEMSNLRWKVTR